MEQSITYSKTPLKRCSSCEEDGEPFLIYDAVQNQYFIYCERCSEDIIFCQTEQAAMAVYLKKDKNT